MAGYTRQSTYADGDIINAADSNNEYNQLLAAFVNTSGHKHDGTAAEGPVIGLIGDPGVATPKNKVVVDDTNNQVEFNIDVSGTSTEQFVVKDGVIEPTTDNDIDLGANSKQFKDAYINGTANIDALVADTADINGGTIDGTVVGGSTAAAITGTTVVANTSINIAGDGATVTGIKDEDNMSSNSATKLATQQSIKAYVDASVTAQDLDFAGDSGGAQNVDLDSQSLTVEGGTGVDTTSSAQKISIAIDSTVATLTGSQTLTNKAITAPILTGSASSAGSILFKEDTDNGTNAVTLIGPAATADVTVTLPAATDTLVGKATTDVFTNKTLTSAVLNGTISGTSIKDEDNMSSDSADHIATQQSIKAYVDASVASIPSGDITSVVAGTGMTGGGTSGDVTLNVIGGTGITANAGDIAIDATVATLTGSQTLTNKSITAPVLTGSASSAGSILFKEDTDNGTNAVTLIGPAATADVTVTLPAATDTLVGKATTDTLTNKTLTTPIVNAGIDLKNGSTSAGFVKFFEDSDNGTNAATLIGPASTADITLTLPSTAGTIVASGDTGTVSNGMLAGSIADSKLNTISTANKVALAALDIDGGTNMTDALASGDLIVIDDGAGGTNKKAALSLLTTFMTSQGFTSDDPTALAIALG
tara:strand:+ start:1382 stop:3331 length:1950 start_codon:yes stop_codon:yes gene_type:complete